VDILYAKFFKTNHWVKQKSRLSNPSIGFLNPYLLATLNPKPWKLEFRRFFSFSKKEPVGKGQVHGTLTFDS
jgi:hypothetical protein